MPLELQIIRASEFVRLGPQEHLDMDETKKSLELIARACRKRGIDQALMDLRHLPIPEKPLFTPAQLAALVDTFLEAGFSENQRLAILYRSDPFHGARMFAFISKMRGRQVSAFTEFEEAVQWLSELNRSPQERGEEVQIRRPRGVAKLTVMKGHEARRPALRYVPPQ